MAKEQYHHGTLKKDLIIKGLQLLNKEGYKGLSLRKVAALCGVSHAAPYKHFKNKDELISAISQEVINSYSDSLKGVVQIPNNPLMQLTELGKQYVKFMVENPDYLKFIFFSGNDCPIIVKNNKFSYTENNNFDILKKCAENYIKSINSKTEDMVIEILTMWSLVHGITLLIVNKNIIYEGNYLNLVEKLITNMLNSKL